MKTLKWQKRDLYTSIYLLCSVNSIEELEGAELINIGIPNVDFWPLISCGNLALTSENSKNLRALWAENPNPVYFLINVNFKLTHFQKSL